MDDLLSDLEQCKNGLLEDLRAIVGLTKTGEGSPEDCRQSLAAHLVELIGLTGDLEDSGDHGELIDVVEEIKIAARKVVQGLNVYSDATREHTIENVQLMGQAIRGFITELDKMSESTVAIHVESRVIDIQRVNDIINQIRTTLKGLIAEYTGQMEKECQQSWEELKTSVKEIAQLGEKAQISVVNQIREPLAELTSLLKQPADSWPSSVDSFTSAVQNFYNQLKEIQTTFKKVHSDEKQSTASRLPKSGIAPPFEGALEGISISRQDPSTMFQMGKCIGKGEGGEVWKATRVGTNQVLAIKKVQLQFKTLSATTREIRTMSKIRHENTLRYYNCYKHGEAIWIVMEFCDLGSIQDIVLKKGCGLDEQFIANITEQVLKGLAYLHSKSYLHRDIKAGNLLMKKSGKVKIADFGTSASSLYLRTTVIGSSYWMAPETIDSSGHDSKADIWSFGCTLLELAERDPPFFNVSKHLVGSSILQSPAPTFKEPEKWSKDFQNFLGFCLRKNPHERKSAQELSQEPWVINRDPRALSIFVKDPIQAVYDPSKVTDMPQEEEEYDEGLSDENLGHAKKGKTTLAKASKGKEDDNKMPIFLSDLKTGKRFHITPEDTITTLLSKCKQGFANKMDESDSKLVHGLYLMSAKGEVHLTDTSGTPLGLLAKTKDQGKHVKFIYKPVA
eukprot:TRINITY_DN754_c0_g1_i7.p1 TRINITY_DN754_c0_g1~~TRINITY_DN754_c0_g1_i7.p1  ORF type:complete len:676 (-),score=131.52 TRINITY_DN754_c0_g1_i7:141-2168(-)